MSPKIHTPVKGFTGNVVGVDFKDGVGETDSIPALGYFERHGYTIEAEESPRELTPKQKLEAEATVLGLDPKGTVSELTTRIAEQKAKQAPPAGDEGTPPADGDKGAE